MLWPLRCDEHDSFVEKLRASKCTDATQHGEQALKDVSERVPWHAAGYSVPLATATARIA